VNVLVSAGPTREPWDPVRYLSNRSSGRMGYSIAEAAQAAGHRVTLVSGPASLNPPRGVRFISVTTAREMQKAVRREYSKSNLVIMAAAVCDFRPKAVRRSKLKKGGAARVALELVPNPDILQGLGRRKGGRTLIGFALETERGLGNARKKLLAKNLDWVVLNGPGALEGEKASVTVLGRDGTARFWLGLPKREIGRRLLKLANHGEK